MNLEAGKLAMVHGGRTTDTVAEEREKTMCPVRVAREQDIYRGSAERKSVYDEREQKEGRCTEKKMRKVYNMNGMTRQKEELDQEGKEGYDAR